MKNIITIGVVCMIALTSFAQKPVVKNGAVVTVLDLGTSSSVLGYSGGTRTMLWADDDLNVVVNFHRMGPGAIPPGLSGYLGMDLGLNMGLTQDDWMPLHILPGLPPIMPTWLSTGLADIVMAQPTWPTLPIQRNT